MANSDSQIQALLGRPATMTATDVTQLMDSVLAAGRNSVTGVASSALASANSASLALVAQLQHTELAISQSVQSSGSSLAQSQQPFDREGITAALKGLQLDLTAVKDSTASLTANVAELMDHTAQLSVSVTEMSVSCAVAGPTSREDLMTLGQSLSSAAELARGTDQKANLAVVGSQMVQLLAEFRGDLSSDLS